MCSRHSFSQRFGREPCAPSARRNGAKSYELAVFELQLDHPLVGRADERHA